MAHLSKVKRLTYDAGWMRWGWPETVGGLGGSTLLRGYLGEALTARGFVEPGIYSMTEVLAPTMIDYARPELAAEMVPRQLRGDETWCQGFSEPGTGSNLAALTCAATRVDDGWCVNGQKVWTSLAQYAQRCVLLDPHRRSRLCAPRHHRAVRRHGHARHHRATDHDDPRPRGVLRGLLRRRARAGRSHARRRGAGLGGGHGPPALRAQHRALAPRRLPAPHARGARCRPPSDGALRPDEVGEAFQQLFALRARSRATQHRMAAGDRLGPETSIDKILLATAEQQIFDLALDGLADEVLLGDDAASEQWRSTLPLLPRRHDLRRQRRDPAQHRRPPPPRPRSGPMMDEEERELFAKGIQHATATSSGAELDAALDELGWQDALGARPGDHGRHGVRAPGRRGARRRRRSAS